MLSPQFRPIVGGYERAAERLSMALATRGHKVTVIAERRNRTWPAREEQNGVQIERLWCLYRPHLHTITSLMAFTVFLITRGRRYQVWHIHQYGMHAVLGVTLGKLLRRPVLLKLTSSSSQGLQQATKILPIARFAKYMLKQVDAIVALTRETQAEAVAFGVPQVRIHRLGNGVDVRSFRHLSPSERVRLRNKLKIVSSGTVIFVGRLSKEKNLYGLLHAWKEAVLRMPAGWKLLIVGDGPMRAQLESFVENEELTSSVSFTGYQSNVSAWMAIADIYVLSSYWEGLSNTMLEAMASGIPVVSSRVSGSAETLEETGAGIVVEIDQIDQLAEALIKLATNPILSNQMGQTGRKIVENRFSIASIAERYEQLYQYLFLKCE